MALPAILGAVLPSAVAGGLGLLNYFGNKPSSSSKKGGQPPIQQVPGQPQGNFLTGYSGYGQQFPRFSPQQQAALSQLLQRGIAGSDVGPIEQRARSQFAQQTVPTLAERFTSLGQNRATSPAFASQLGQAGANLEEGLAALRSQYAMQQAQLGLSPLFENIYIPGQGGALAPLAQSAGQTLPLLTQGLSSYFSQPQQNQQQDTMAMLQQLLSQLTPEQISSLLGQQEQSQDILAPLRDKSKQAAPTSYDFLQALQRPNYQLTA